MSRFRAKRSSRCCELCRNVGLRDIGESRHRGLERNAVRGVASCCEMRGCAAAVLVATGLGVSTPFLLRVPKHFRAMVAHAARSLAFRGAGRSCSRRAEPGFPGRRQQFLAPHRAWLLGHARSCHSRPSPDGWRRMWRACAQEVCKPDNSRRAGHAKVANTRRCRTNANSAAIILQV